MKVYGDIETVNLATGERFRRVAGDGESRLVREHDPDEKGVCKRCGANVRTSRECLKGETHDRSTR